MIILSASLIEREASLNILGSSVLSLWIVKERRLDRRGLPPAQARRIVRELEKQRPVVIIQFKEAELRRLEVRFADPRVFHPFI